MTIDLFLASSVARREGCAGGLRVQDTAEEEVGVEGGEVVVGGCSARVLCSSSFIHSFLEVMVMDCRVVL